MFRYFLRSYKWIICTIFVIFIVQVFLAYKSLKLFKFDAALPPSASLERASLSGQNETVAELNVGGGLILHPTCDVSQNREVISAVQRATTDICRRQILDVACSIKNGQLYPKWLPSSCPKGGQQTNRYVGCYKDTHDDRLLTGYFSVLKSNNTPRKCIHICLQSGFMYAGTQYSNECFCGNQVPTDKLKLPDNSCNMRCSGDSNLTCGGYYTIAIYETGIEGFTPQLAEMNQSKVGARSAVRIAFLLTLNGRAIRQVYRLIKSLSSKENQHFFYIHVDARQHYLFRELLTLETRFSNIRLARQRFATIWGGASLLEMLIKSMDDLLKSNWQWDYVINLSESDFPVKTVDSLVGFLTANAGRNFVKSHGRETQRFIQKQGLDRTFVECDTRMWRIGERELPENIQIDGGSDWFALSREFVRFVVHQNTTDDDKVLIEGLLILFKKTLLPGESFFHTVLRNSVYCSSYVDNNLHITNWRRKLGCKCQYKHIVDWCGCSPNDFKLDDWERLENTASKAIFFARKFEPVINHAIIVKLEEWLHGPHPARLVNLNSYWQNVYHHFDDFRDKDAILATSLSLIRIQSRKLNYVADQILEVTNFFENDNYRGFLILHEAHLDNGDVIEFEMLIKPNQTGQISKTSALSKRIQVLEVSSDFDQKEQVSRNFAKTLSTDSEPHLVLKFGGSTTGETSYNFTIIWYAPNGELADISEMFIEDASSASINLSKPALSAPLSQGVWLVKILHRKNLIGLCKFLIVPNYNVQNTKDLLTEETDQIDNLVETFFTIRDICIIQGQQMLRFQSETEQFKNLVECNKTKWSSRAPDPKSEID